MVEYKCFRCGYIASQRINLRHHFNRKNTCEPILEDISIETMLNHYNFITPKNSPQNSSIIPQNSSFMENETPQKSSFLDKKLLKNPHFKYFPPQKSSILHNSKSSNLRCEFCSKTYSRSDNLKRHLSSCKKKKECEQLIILEKEKKIEELEKELEKQKMTNITNNTNNTINNNNSTNITNNIIINNLGEENVKHLKSGHFANLLQGIYGAVPKLIKQIHFDPEHPENQNIKFTNKKYPYLKIMKDNKWQLVNKKPELLDLIDSKCFMLKEKYYKILEKKQYKLSTVQKNKIDTFIDKYQEEDTELILDLINRTELVLLNNS